MHPKFIAFALYIWMIGMLVGMIGDGVEWAVSGGLHQSELAQITSWSEVTVEQDFGVLEFALQMPGFLGTIFNVITLNFGWLNEGAYVLIRWIAIMPIVAMMVWGVIITFFGIFQRTA